MGRLSFDPHDPADVEDFEAFLCRLSPLDREIAEKFMAGHTQAEIAASVGFSQQAVSKRIKTMGKRGCKNASPNGMQIGGQHGIAGQDD